MYPFRLKPDKGPLEAFLNAISGEHILLAAGTPKTNTEPTPTPLTTVWLSHLVNEKLIRRWQTVSISWLSTIQRETVYWTCSFCSYSGFRHIIAKREQKCSLLSLPDTTHPKRRPSWITVHDLWPMARQGNHECDTSTRSVHRRRKVGLPSVFRCSTESSI